MKTYSADVMKKLSVSLELRNRADIVVDECIKKANEMYGAKVYIVTPGIIYKHKGVCGGKAYVDKNIIDINPILFNENVDEILNQVIPHEVAHLITHAIYGYDNEIRSHGWQWQSVMKSLGKSPDRCHTMDLSTIKKMKNKIEYVYKCKCKDYIPVSKIRHNNIVNKGKHYRCNNCDSRIEYVKTVTWIP